MGRLANDLICSIRGHVHAAMTNMSARNRDPEIADDGRRTPSPQVPEYQDRGELEGSEGAPCVTIRAPRMRLLVRTYDSSLRCYPSARGTELEYRD